MMTMRRASVVLALLLFVVRNVRGFGARLFLDMSTTRRSAARMSISKSHTIKKTTVTSQLSASSPKLIVFRMDNTVWTPELYTLRNIQHHKKIPVAGKDVKLFPGAQAALDMKKAGKLLNIRFAVASRTKSVDWAHDLLDQFGIREHFDHVEIFPGNKQTHFANLQAASGIAFHEMLFFDDARDGKYGNCVHVAELGVLSVHCPNGLVSASLFEIGLQRFSQWDGSKGTLVEWDGTVTKTIYVAELANYGERHEGTVKFFNTEKRFGFIRYGDRSTKDLFFHQSSLPLGSFVQEGDKISFELQRDPKNGENVAVDVLYSGVGSEISDTVTKTKTVTIRAFSMNMPFAALLTNGYKTLETRNGTMFVNYPEGTQMLLHVGQRTYPDGDKHVDVMKNGGLGDDEITKLKSLPSGFDRGMAVAICEIGKTYETTVEERSDPQVQLKVAAYGRDSGKMVTEIKRVQYLKRPVEVAAQGGVFKVQIDPALIPDGWTFPTDETNGNLNTKANTAKSTKSIYSISG